MWPAPEHAARLWARGGGGGGGGGLGRNWFFIFDSLAQVVTCLQCAWRASMARRRVEEARAARREQEGEDGEWETEEERARKLAVVVKIQSFFRCVGYGDKPDEGTNSMRAQI